MTAMLGFYLFTAAFWLGIACGWTIKQIKDEKMSSNDKGNTTNHAIEQSRPEQILRRLLAYRVAGQLLYTDDGELQDASVWPWIDFKRDSVDSIEEKLGERTRKALAIIDAPSTENTDTRHLGELLARIHRDGGHHQLAVGTEQAVKDANTIVSNLYAPSTEQPADPYETVYCQMHGCAPHGLVSCDTFNKWKTSITSDSITSRDTSAGRVEPVKASVDGAEFQDLIGELITRSYMEGSTDNAIAALYTHINAWGAQQREAGRRDRDAEFDKLQARALRVAQCAGEFAKESSEQYKAGIEYAEAAYHPHLLRQRTRAEVAEKECSEICREVERVKDERDGLRAQLVQSTAIGETIDEITRERDVARAQLTACKDLSKVISYDVAPCGGLEYRKSGDGELFFRSDLEAHFTKGNPK